MITPSTLWKKALKCNVTFVNNPALTSEYLRSQLLFVSLLCKSATPNSTLSLHHHPRLKNLCLHHDSGTAGTEGRRKKARAFALLETRAAASPCAATRCWAGENWPVKNKSLRWRGWGGVGWGEGVGGVEHSNPLPEVPPRKRRGWDFTGSLTWVTAPLPLLRYNERDEGWPSSPLAAGITARSLVPTSLFTQSSAPVPSYPHFFFFFCLQPQMQKRRKRPTKFQHSLPAPFLLQLSLKPNNWQHILEAVSISNQLQPYQHLLAVDVESLPVGCRWYCNWVRLHFDPQQVPMTITYSAHDRDQGDQALQSSIMRMLFFLQKVKQVVNWNREQKCQWPKHTGSKTS